MVKTFEELLKLLKDENVAYTVTIYQFMRKTFKKEEQ
jgi:hypothetical protein